MKPVTLVSAVVSRNSAVQPGSGRLVAIPPRAVNPATMATRLMMTCTVVKVEIDMPRIMTYAFPVQLRRWSVQSICAAGASLPA
jgi:hypothetical protein